MATKRFSKPVLAALDANKIIGLRAGVKPHRFLGIWVVVHEDRAFVRPWDNSPSGWFDVLQADPRGAIQLLSGRQINVRTRVVRSEAVWDAVDRAYASKYDTPGAQTYVRGFKTPKRRTTTTELMPR